VAEVDVAPARRRRRLLHVSSQVEGSVAEVDQGRGTIWLRLGRVAEEDSGLATDISETALREDLLPTGWVDNKVCAIDSTWSGLRFVLRKENRPGGGKHRQRARDAPAAKPWLWG